jgi:hypothetical protein
MHAWQAEPGNVLTSAVPSKWCVMTVVPLSSVTGLRCSEQVTINSSQSNISRCQTLPM